MTLYCTYYFMTLCYASARARARARESERERERARDRDLLGSTVHKLRVPAALLSGMQNSYPKNRRGRKRRGHECWWVGTLTRGGGGGSSSRERRRL